MKKNNRKFLVLVLSVSLSIASILAVQSSVHAMPQSKGHTKDYSTLMQNKIKVTYSKLPLYFEINKGQTNKEIKFLSRGLGYGFFLKQDEAVLRLNKFSLKDSSLVSLKLVGANTNAKIEGLDKLQGKVNYFIGNNLDKWLKGIHTYKKVKYSDIYSGIDLVYYGNQNQLEYDFIVSPGADPKAIKISFSGIEDLNINKKGQLILYAPGGDIVQHEPIIYQVIGGVKHKREGNYVLSEDGKSIGFNVLAYDTSVPLIIDPVLVYSTFLGGVNNDFGWAIDVDSKGNAYVTGSTLSVSDFPTTSGVVQPNFGGGAAGSNIFVTKFNPQGVPVYSTYIGGSGLTFGFDIKVDKDGNAYVAGTAYSQTDFPTTMGAFQTTFGGGAADAVVVKLNPSGSSLVFSTFVGGTFFDGGADQFGIADEGKNGTGGLDECNDGVDNDADGSIDGGDIDCSIFDSFWHMGIDIDDEKNVCVSGTTFSPDFPTTQGAFQTAKAGSGPTDAFVTKLNPNGTSLIYSTYLGGASGETASDLAVDEDGNVVIVGTTGSTDFPTTQGSFQADLASPGNGYVTKLNPSGSALVYSSYIGGSSGDQADGVALDSNGNAYVTGLISQAVNPPFFPATEGAFQKESPGGFNDAFVAKVSPSGSLVYATFLGGTQFEHGNSIAVDENGSAYVIGHTNSNDFPTKDEIQTEPNDGGFDVFVTKLNPNGSALEYSTYLGSSQFEDGLGITVDSNGAAYVTGYTEVPVNPPFFPTTEGAFQTQHKGNSDAFVAKISGKASSDSPPPDGDVPDETETPNLTGSWIKVVNKCRGKELALRCRIKGRLHIENIGTKDAPTSFVKFFLSSDSAFDSDDTFLKQVATGEVKVQSSKFRTLAFKLPKGTDAKGKFILAVLDADNAIDESNETDNTVVSGPLP